jgi:hypothetical protein
VCALVAYWIFMLMLRNLIRWIAGVVLAWGLLIPACQAVEPPLSVILDTDAGGDCDDIGALFLLHGAVERGEVKLLATMGCTSSKSIAPCLDSINRWFGRPAQEPGEPSPFECRQGQPTGREGTGRQESAAARRHGWAVPAVRQRERR